MPKTIYLCTCKDAYEEEKIAFAKREDAENFMRDCIDYAFEDEERDTDDLGNSKEECVDDWYMRCGDYVAQVDTINLFE